MAPLHKATSLGTKTLHHFTHPNHLLQLVHISKEYLCDGCNTSGFGLRYCCHACEFDLHEQCATCPLSLSSPLHPSHPLSLANQTVRDRFCDVCGDLVCGLYYTCSACQFDVHPLCTQLPLYVRHGGHPQHILALQPSAPSCCTLCFQACTAWRYRCNTCGFDVHPECLSSAGACNSPSGWYVPQVSPLGGCVIGAPVAGQTMGGALIIQTGNNGQTSGGTKKSSIYSVLGKLAARAVVTSIIGIPFG